MVKTAEQIETQIITAYRKLATEPGAWVALARLRTEIDETINRHEMDEALRQLTRRTDMDAYLVPENNQKTLTQRDHDSAVWMGGQWKHLLAIYAG